MAKYATVFAIGVGVGILAKYLYDTYAPTTSTNPKS